MKFQYLAFQPANSV